MNDDEKNCKCAEIPRFLHDLVQSAQIIQSYARGCYERIKADNFESKEEFSNILNEICEHVQIMGNKIHSFSENQ